MDVKCIIDNDIADILTLMEGAGVRIFATQLYIDNISDMLKVIIDRMIVMVCRC